MGIEDDGQATGDRDSEEILLQKRLEAHQALANHCGECESRRCSGGSSVNGHDNEQLYFTNYAQHLVC